MELIVISENKLKIMMSRDDMIKVGLDENEFYLSVTNTRKILERILHNCPIKTGFESILPDEKLLMQLYPEKSGGCELFVTKIEFENDRAESEDESFMAKLSEERFLLPKPRAKETEEHEVTLTYRFEKLDFVILACKELLKRGFFHQSALKKDENGKYYLFMTQQRNENEKSSPTSFLSEFGELEKTEHASLYLSEYGSCIIKNNAIEQLADL